jgi:hypothetical protein
LLSFRNLKVRALRAPVEIVVATRNVAEAKQAGHIFQDSFLSIRRSTIGNSTFNAENISAGGAKHGWKTRTL